ncbi:hypothetical protein [Nocardia brasiliensis]|uniref:acyl-CoA dehydrogenase family protein n=1 Tax=Nocardia brasiliensis TaxID=37326 RepID=UPI002457B92B|nr:hypothetical protein [Nocardia brasiliensis]
MVTRGYEERTSLSERLRHGSRDFRHQLQDILSNPAFAVTEKQSQEQRRQNAYDQLRDLVKEVGSTRSVATNLPELFAVFDWSAVLATDLIPLISGHYNLASGSLATLTDSASAAPYLADLDDVSSVGIPVARVCVIGARFIDTAGVDQGVHLFAARLRGADGEPCQGVTITQLDHQPLVIMDNSVISFDNLRVERGAWLSNDLATIDAAGVLTWYNEGSRKRAFASAISQLTVGRLALSSCLNATARAALYMALRYAAKRVVPLTSADSPFIIEIPHVRDTLLTDLAGTVARTVYGNAIKTFLAGSDLADRETVVAVMLAKHFIQLHALDTVNHCRIKMGAQGMFSANRVADYLGVCHPAITGEGDCHGLGSVAGRVLAKQLSGTLPPEARLHDPADPGDRAHLFGVRTLTIAQEAQPHLATPALADRLTVILEALELAESYCAEEALSLLHRHGEVAEIRSVRDVFALHYPDQHAAWYLTRGLLDNVAVETTKRLLRRAIQDLADSSSAPLDAFDFDDEILGAPALSEDLPAAWDSRCSAPIRH